MADGDQQGQQQQGQQQQQGNDGQGQVKDGQQQQQDDAALLAAANNPDAVKAALDREREAAKAARKEADEARAKVKEFEDAKLSDQEKKDKEKAEAEQRATAAEAKALKYEVAAEKGVPLAQAHRLQGSTKEELEKDADAFLKDVKPGGGGGQLDGGPRGAMETPEDMDAAIRQAAGYR
jgi:membrane protein involved in colicin uptake